MTTKRCGNLVWDERGGTYYISPTGHRYDLATTSNYTYFGGKPLSPDILTIWHFPECEEEYDNDEETEFVNFIFGPEFFSRDEEGKDECIETLWVYVREYETKKGWYTRC